MKGIRHQHSAAGPDLGQPLRHGVKVELGIAAAGRHRFEVDILDGKPGTGANNPGKEKVGKVTRAQVEEIVKTKMNDLNAHDLDQAMSYFADDGRGK